MTIQKYKKYYNQCRLLKIKKSTILHRVESQRLLQAKNSAARVNTLLKALFKEVVSLVVCGKGFSCV